VAVAVAVAVAVGPEDVAVAVAVGPEAVAVAVLAVLAVGPETMRPSTSTQQSSARGLLLRARSARGPSSCGMLASHYFHC
jgi:hypothetical protein